jgi:hypothetical protein
VTSSGAIIPARPPPSIDMLQTVMRPSIERARMADPAYSMTCPWAPATPIWPIVPRIRSFAPTPTPTSPSMLMRIVRGGAWVSVCVARTCSTSLVPMPKARAPKAPWVEVWLSPQTIVIPGWVTPSSGPMMWTMPWRELRIEKSGMPNSAALRSSASIWARESGSAIPASRPMVGTLWSTVASVRSGRRTRRPARRRPSNACGEVTPCTRCRSTNRIAGPLASAARTSCWSHTFWNRVFPAITLLPPRRARPARRGGSR